MAYESYESYDMTYMDPPRKVKRTFFRLHGDMEQAEHVENFTQFQKTDKGKKISAYFRCFGFSPEIALGDGPKYSR